MEREIALSPMKGRMICQPGLELACFQGPKLFKNRVMPGDWIKVKCIQSDTFAIVGYEPSTKVPGAIASLLLAARKGNELVYVGSVGTGFKHAEAVALRRRLDAMVTAKPAVKLKNKKLAFVEPTLAAEIEYRAWTRDGQLRHASFKGLREAADHAEVFTSSS